MSIIKIRGRDAKPVLLILVGFLMPPVCTLLIYFSTLFAYGALASMVLADIGLVWFWLIWRRRRGNPT